MEWNAWYYSINRNKIVKFNVFEHRMFNKDVQANLKKYQDKTEFAERLRGDLFYYFCSKAEWELIITLTEDGRVLLSPWCGCRNPEDVTIDVTDDKSFDWRGFAEKHIAHQVFKNEAKIDVRDQIAYTMDKFVDYVWEGRKRK